MVAVTYELQLDFAKVLGEGLFYGAEFVLMIGVTYIQLTSRHLLSTHKVLLVIADLMFLLASAHLGLLMYELFTGSVPSPILRAAVAVSHFQMAFGDLVLIWRVWVVWNRDFRSIVLPLLVLAASFVFGMMNTAKSITYNDLAKILPTPTVVLAVGNTTLCTTLIAGRLAYLDHLINGHLQFSSAKRLHSYRAAILMVVESAAVLAIANIINMVLLILKHPGLHVMLNITTPLTAIVPTTIVVLSHLQLTPGDTANQTVTVHFASNPELSANFHSAVRRQSGPGSNSHEEFTWELAAATRSASSLDIEKQPRLL
ncbi:hypothetical protein LXA43DRAFT_140207 [Ganoderma leucocontextum]|nr:hypothetical protein LXA43DRAFT_140207 [Ganoderma leucocontextum]